jgi:hypothetical protein
MSLGIMRRLFRIVRSLEQGVKQRPRPICSQRRGVRHIHTVRTAVITIVTRSSGQRDPSELNKEKLIP